MESLQQQLKLALFLLCSAGLVASQDSYYANSCPTIESIARSTLQGLLVRDPTATAAMTRLAFHDCQGCDASILLNSGSDGTLELQSAANLGIRRLDIIDDIKARLEAACPQTMSCADIIARDAIVFSGGPDIPISLGRLDGFDASKSAADADLTPATISVPDMLIRQDGDERRGERC